MTVGENLTKVLALITTGLKPWEYKFLASYASLPSMLCKVLPVVELFGQAGSGKTQLLLAVAALSGRKGDRTSTAFLQAMRQGGEEVRREVRS